MYEELLNINYVKLKHYASLKTQFCYMRITDSYYEDLAVIIIFFKSMQSSKTLISYTSKERRYQPLAFFQIENRTPQIFQRSFHSQK